MAMPFLGRRRSSSIKKEFSEKELKELRTAFDLLDRNQDGKVTTREFKIMLNNLGIDVKEKVVEELIRSASHAGKELIDENDFLKFVKQIQDLCPIRNTGEDEELNLLAAFKVFDLDNDGFITKDELRIAMEMIDEEISEDQLNHIMEVADTDKDGKINYKGKTGDSVKFQYQNEDIKGFLKTLNFILNMGLDTAFKEITKAWRILVTIPMTTADAERIFPSNVRRTKNLRPTNEKHWYFLNFPPSLSPTYWTEIL